MTASGAAGALLALADRVEHDPDDRQAWGEAFDLLHPEPRPKAIGAQLTNEWLAWNDLQATFLSARLKGFLRDAAAMLMPPNSNTSIEMNWSGKPMACVNAFQIDRATGKQVCGSTDGEAYEPHAEARATLACALRLRAKLMER